MQEEDLPKKQDEELQYLNQRIKEISEKEAKILAEEARTITEFVESKMKILKTCYGKSDATVKESINRLIRSSQLQCFMAEAETEETKLDKMMYSERRIKDHINDGLLDEPRIREFYSFYFGRYRLFFRCFERDFLEQENIDVSFLDDVFSPKEGDYYVSGQRLEIAGATIIDEEFIEKVKAGKHFTEAEFYGAKQTYFCQWYGIIHEYDVIRNGYETLKNIIIDSFIEEKHEKVTAIICGSGGSGKSTVLRRTAVDLHKESIHIVWVEDSGIEEFVEKGFSAIKSEVENNEKQKFVIIIEDWYRVFTKENEQSGIDILKKAKNINNIRFVIGDRSIKRSYTEHRNNDFELHLSSDDNKEIIEKIVEKHPNWKLASEKLFNKKNDKNYKSSLFLLLFILAHIDQKEFNNTALNLAEPQQVFQRIIESDLRFIEKKYKGLAKAIYYLSFVYTKYKVSINYETFLKIADFYNEKNNNQIFDKFRRFSTSDKILDRLKLYINKNHSNQDFNAYDLIQFNHDIFAELGFKNIIIEEWQDFDIEIKLDFLKVITEKGDDYSASRYLSTLINKERDIFIDKNEILDYIKILIEKGNSQPHYLYNLGELHLDDATMVELAQLFWKKKIFSRYSTFFWREYFRQVKGEVLIHDQIHEILNISNLQNFSDEFIICLLNNTHDIETRDLFARMVVSDENNKFSVSIKNECLNYVSHILKNRFLHTKLDGEIENLIPYFSHYINTQENFIKSRFQNKIIYGNNWKKLQAGKLISFISFLRDKVIQEFFIVKVLENIENKDSFILRFCFMSVSDKIKIKFSSLFLDIKKYEYNRGIITECFTYAPFKIKQDISNRILKDHTWMYYDTNLLDEFILYAEIQFLKEFSLMLFRTKIWENLSHNSILRLLTVCEDKNISQQVSQLFIFISYNLHTTYIQTSLFRIYLFNSSPDIRGSILDKYLESNNYKNTALDKQNYSQVYDCFIVADVEKKKNFCNKILQDCWKQYDYRLVIMCLDYMIKEHKIPSVANEIVNEYTSNKNSKQFMENYQAIFTIALGHFEEWKKEAENIIENWKQSDKIALTNLLPYYFSSPKKIYYICKEILECWNKEYKFYKFNRKDWNRFEIALGHPQLKQEAKETAQLMQNIFDNRKMDAPIEFRRVLFQIVENDIYPEWQI
ncbi:hypothetical protein [Chryseobacterium candidae]|uniref:Novel STAND NTPase 5 domain-containing protein n=1 Tax=Chryseobacterium candidae TaxID=1978493 RepID=A0ABY2R9X8_9FLAO|nr:hypothetical protein [Chryseobacterium candidae]THV60722.1 hypothetical protein EK417_09045 [Chryseobacterium candidae]